MAKQRQRYTGITRTFIVTPAVNVGEFDFVVVDEMNDNTEATIIAYDNDKPDDAEFILQGIRSWKEACEIAETLCAQHNMTKMGYKHAG